MKPAPFTLHRPAHLEDALTLLDQSRETDARILAGGQSLVPAMALRLSRPAVLIDINAIADFSKLTRHADRIDIGATVRHAAFHAPVTPDPLGALLSTVVRHIAHYPIRQRGTFCGSLANADPASEWCLVATTLNARITATSPGGTRTIPISEFFHGVMTTELAADELITSLSLPTLAPDTRYGFAEFSRRAGDFAIAMALVTYRLENGVIHEARVGLGAVEPNPRRLASVEAALNGERPSDDLFKSAARLARDDADPLDDWQATAEDRKALATTMIERALCASQHG